MLISYNWLQDYVFLRESPEEVAALLTSAGLEVEGIRAYESVPGSLNGIVVGMVTEVGPHPNADRLRCTKVDIGVGEVLPIVCGAANVAEGQKVAVAPVGTKLFPAGGEPFVIREAKIRGEMSRGMICAEDEIGLGSDHSGIMVLPENAEVGAALNKILKVYTDSIFEIGLTPNRADAASHYGVARDLRALLLQRSGRKVELCRPSVQTALPKADKLREIMVKVADEAICPRYVGVVLSDVRVLPSPIWLTQRLQAIGIRPINNVVDITNYINHSFGQPLHAFDADAITSGEVHVKTLQSGTKFITLDGVERALHSNDLMICNGNEPMCIAGVFGGLGSGVTDKTTSVFLESAYFHPTSIRKTAKRHGLHTDASFRFERGINPNLTLFSAQVAAQMMVEYCGAKVASGFSDSNAAGAAPFRCAFRPERMRSLLGVSIPDGEVERLLESLEISVSERFGETWNLSVPAFKVDVQREVDVMEEVIRIYGIDRIPVSEKLRTSMVNPSETSTPKSRALCSAWLVAQGFVEAMSNSMCDVLLAGKIADGKRLLHIRNPLSSELGYMRPALLVSALSNVAFNHNRQHINLKIFEFGNVYGVEGGIVREEERLGITVTGLEVSESWRIPDMAAGWYTIKAVLEGLMIMIGVDDSKLTCTALDDNSYTYGLEWKSAKQSVMWAGKVSKPLLEHSDIKREVWHAEIRWPQLVALRKSQISVGDLPRFPWVRRDLAMLVDRSVRYDQLERLAWQRGGALLRSVSLFDVYEGKGLPDGKKSYALAFVLRSDERTLTDQEVESVMQTLESGFSKELGAEVRR